MKNIVTSLFILLSFITISFAQNQSNIQKFDKDKLLEHLEILSSDKFEGRKTGEKGNDSARAYIIQEFKKLNVSGFNGQYEYPFSFETRQGKFKANNILAEIIGTAYPEKYIVVSAHYDHLGKKGDEIYNGADDDASGVAALFSFAEHLSKNPPKHSIILAAFDAEEMGLQGAKYFVEKMKDQTIVANINMDMISRSAKDELYVVGARYDKSLQKIIDNFENPTTSKLLEGHDGSDGKQDWTMSSDHGPFHLANIPFLYFGNEDHAAYHKPTDVYEDIIPQFYKNSVTIILSIFEAIDSFIK